MALRTAFSLVSRSVHTTSSSLRAAHKLPFEKPIFQSEIVDKAVAERDACKRLEFYGNVAVILVGMSAVARLGYYVVYGKEGGAKPLPRRSDA